MTKRTLIGISLLGMTSMGCGKDSDDTGDLSDYDAMTAIFSESCGAGCHTDGSSSGSLALDAASAAANLVDMPADGDSDWTRVVCGDSDNSALYQKLFDPAPFGDPMPLGTGLSEADLAVIKAWIDGDECG